MTVSTAGGIRTDDIVVVDDDSLFVEYLQRRVRKTDVQAEFFADADDALTYMMSHNAKALVVDTIMPLMSGLELLQALSERGRLNSIKCYLCSTIEPPAEIVSAAKALGAQFLLKDELRCDEPFKALLN